MYIPDIDKKIKQLRVQRGLSQAELAKLLRVSKSVLSSYENSVHLPPYDVLLRIANIFCVSTDYLLGAVGNRCIPVDGLTDTQVEAVASIVQELQQLNRQAQSGG